MSQGYKINIKTEIKNLEEFERLRNEVKEFEKNNKIQLFGNINYNKMFSDLNLVQNHVDKLSNNKIKINLQNDNWNGTKQDIKEYRKYIKEVEQELKNEEVARNKINEAIEKTILQRNKESEALERNQANSINKNLDSNWKDIIKANDSINKSLKNTKEKFKNVINSNDLNKINKFEKELQSLSPTSQTLNKDIENLKTQIDNFNKSLSEKSKVQKFGERLSGFGKLNLESSVKDIEKFAKESVDAQAKVVKLGEVVEKNGHKIRQATLQWQDSSGLLRTNKLTLDDTTQSIYKSSDAFKQAKDSQHGFISSLKDMGAAALSYISIHQLLLKGMQEFKNAIETVNDINKLQTNVRMVTGMGKDSVERYTNSVSKLSKELHSTTTDSMKASEEFLRTGRNAKESMDMVKSATIMARLSGDDMATTSQELVAISNAYGIASDRTLGIVDKLTTVDNNAATSTKELAQALSRTSSSAKAAGVGLEKITSWIGVVSSVSRKSAESIGESFKTIFARMNDIKQSSKIDPYNEQLSQVETSLNKVGVALRKDKKTFRNMGDVINDVAKKWGTLDEVRRNDVAKSIAGVRQRENFILLMDHYNESLELEKKQLDSAGSATKRYGIYADSTEGKIKDFKESVIGLYRTMANSNFINKAIGNLTKFMNKLNEFAHNTTTKSKLAILGLGIAWVTTFAKFKTISELILKTKALSSGFLALSKSIGVVDALALSFGRLGMSIKATTLALLKNPMTWFIAALGLATVAVVRHIRKQKELQAQNKKVKESYDSLNEAMKKGTINSKDNKGEIDTLKQQKKALDEVINKRKALQKEIAKMQSSNRADRGALQQLNQAKNKLNGLDKEIHQVGSAFEKAGMHVDYMTGAVIELDNAEQQCMVNDLKKKIDEEAQARVDNINTILDEIDEYNDLSNAENLNAEQKQRLSQLAYELQGKIEGLKVTTDEHGNTVIENTELLGKNKDALIKEKGELGANAEAAKINAINRIRQENAKTEAVVNQVNQRIRAYQDEIRALREEEAEIQRAGFFAKWIDKVSGHQAQRNKDIKDRRNKIGQEIENRKAYEKELKDSNKRIQEILNYKPKIDDRRAKATPSNPNISDYGGNDGGGYYPSEHGSGGGRKGRKSGSGSKGSKGKKEKSAEQQAKDRLQKIKEEIDKKLKEYEDKVRLIDSRIKSLQDKKSLSEENSQDRVSLQNQIELYMKQKIDVLKQKEAFIRSEMNKHKGTEIFKELNRQLLDTKDNISSLYTEISKAKETMIDDKYNAKLKNINKSIKDIKEQIDIIDSKDTFNKDKLNNMDKLIAKTKEQRNTTSSFVQELEKQLKVSKDLATQSALRNSIKKYKEQLHEMNVEVNKLLVSKGQLIKDLTFEAEFIDKYSRKLEQLNNRLKEFEFNLNKIDINIESNKAKGDIHKAFEDYEQYLKEMQRKELELKNQSMNLKRTMKDLTDEFSKNFGIDLTRVNKEQLDSIYDELFKQQMVGSKEEKEALEKREELYKRLVDDYMQYVDAVQENELTIGNIQNEINEKIKEQHDLMQESLKSIQDQVKEMLKQEVEDEKKAYDEKLDRLRKFVDDSIKQKERLWKAEDYNRDLNKKINDKNKLKAEIAEKSRDTSIAGRNAVRKLKEQLANMNEDIEKFQTQHNRDMEKQNLTDLLAQAERETEKKKKELDKQLDDQKLNIKSQEALINGFYTNAKGQIVKLQDSMVNFLEKTSDGLSFLGKQLKKELINNLEQANKLLNGYGSGFIQYNTGVAGASSQNIQSILRESNVQFPQIKSNLKPYEFSKDKVEPTITNQIESVVKIDGNCYDKGDLVDLITKGVDNGMNKIKNAGLKRGYNPMLIG